MADDVFEPIKLKYDRVVMGVDPGAPEGSRTVMALVVVGPPVSDEVKAEAAKYYLLPPGPMTFDIPLDGFKVFWKNIFHSALWPQMQHQAPKYWRRRRHKDRTRRFP